MNNLFDQVTKVVSQRTSMVCGLCQGPTHPQDPPFYQFWIYGASDFGCVVFTICPDCCLRIA